LGERKSGGICKRRELKRCLFKKANFEAADEGILKEGKRYRTFKDSIGNVVKRKKKVLTKSVGPCT